MAPALSLSVISVLGVLHKYVLIAVFLQSLPLLLKSPPSQHSSSICQTLHNYHEVLRFRIESKFLFIVLKTSSFFLNLLIIPYLIIDYFLDLCPPMRWVFSSTGWPSLCLPSLSPSTSSPWTFFTSLCRAQLPIIAPLLDYFVLIFFPFSGLPQHVEFVILSLTPGSTQRWNIFKLLHLCESCLPLIG